MTRKKHHYQYHHMLQRAFQMLCFHLVLLSFFNTNNLVKAENIAMFTDNLVTDYRQIIVNQSVYIDGLLLNTSLVDRYESTKYCLLSTISSSMQNGQTSLVKNLMQYSNYTKNTFESKKVYVPCELVIELFCNTNTPVKYVVTHSAFDCGDLLNPNQTTYDLVSDDYSNDTTSTSTNIMKVIYLSPTVQQIEISLKSFMNRYSLTHYGIVYTNSFLYGSSSSWSVRAVNFYQQFAADLVYQLSNDLSFNLDFSVQLYDPTLPYILTSYVKIIFLVLRCGEEAIFMKLYWSQINAYGINVIAIYDSPQCLAVVNINNQFSTLNSTQLSTYKYLYKLVAVDINNDFVSYGNRLQSMIYQNLQNNYLYESSNVLDEIESYYQASYYNSTRNTTSLNELNETTTLKCFVSSQILSTNLTFKYCYRRVQFILFGFNNSTNNYSQVGYITLPDITNTETSYNATVTMFGNYTFQQITTTPTTTTSNDEIFKDVLFAVIAMVIFVVLVGILAYIARSRLMRKELSKGPNKILLLPEDLEFVTATSSTFLSRQNVRDQNDQNKSQHSLKSEQGTTNTMGMGATRIAKYKGDIVVVKYLKIPNFQMKNSTMREFRMLRDLRHENLNVFMGCYIDLKSPALIFDYATRGSLQDIILKKDIKLDWNFKWSMLNDLCRGMRYLHHSPLKYHGNLKSRNCVVDSRWVLKVTDFGLPNMYSNQNYSRTLNLSDLLWTAPEHLRQTTIRDQVVISIGSQSGDIYSFAIIMQELIVRGTPFCMMGLTDEEIINKIRKPPPLLRPSVSKTAAPPEYVNIMRDCWSEQPELRPTFDQLYSMFKSLNGDKKVNIVDLMFKMIEQYTNNLEDLVKEKTVKLEEEKKKTEKLLSEMLPKTVAESLMSGGTVPPESFDMVTIYFSDIVGFTTISAYSSPFEVVQLLNDLYTMFDDICDDFDVYKVETIGDAYMVVSGLPIRNGNKHAGEIATMALNLLHHCGKFKIRHLPGIPLRLRIGLHSGACVSGVVGSKMPRYCLFGDTVNTASRMESTSQAYRIHVSQSCATILDEIGGYQLELRGETELKGKGKHKTYWLVGKDGFDKELPDPVVSENNHGIDSQLIQTIERIKAEQKLAKKEEKQEEMVVHNPSIFKELTALESGRKKSKNADIDEEDEEEEGGRKLSESMKITSSREGLKSAGKNRASTGSHGNTLGMKTTMPQMPPKNDSGFSEPITANSTPTSGKLPANVDHKPSAAGKPKMPDVDSVV